MIKTRRTKRTFSPEFKLEAIGQVVKYQRDVREVALALELNPDHLRKWIRLYKQELQGIEPTGNAVTTDTAESKVASAGSLSFIRCSPQRLLCAGEASC